MSSCIPEGTTSCCWRTLDLAFLTDITGKLNSLNCELQGKGMIVGDISALNAFTLTTNILSVHLQKKRAALFPAGGAERQYFCS